VKRYHFSIDGTVGHIGVAGAIFATSDDEALGILQEALDQMTDRMVVDNYRYDEPDLARASVGLSYIAVYTNSAKATMDMFDEIEDDGSEAAARAANATCR